MDDSVYDVYREQGIAVYIKGKPVIGIHPDNVEWTVKSLDEGTFKIAWQHHLDWVLKQNTETESHTLRILKEELDELKSERNVLYATDRIVGAQRLKELDEIILDVTDHIKRLH